jgi:acyl-CoA synthetase (AMP-forming)/AMP-acid ligase II
MSGGDALYGKRPIPALIDHIAHNDPERICFSFPASSNLSDGFRDMSFRTFANAINKTAHFIHQEIGRSSMFETVMYMGFPDVRHYIVLVALMKTGHKALFSSHRNSVAAHADLIRKTDCTILLHSSGFPVSGILEKCRMESLVMPELDYLLDDTPSEPYPYRYSWEEAKNHPCLVFHTLGFSGLPKPVIWPHSALLTLDTHHLLEPIEGREVIWNSVFGGVRRSFHALAMFHGSGICLGIARALFTGTTVVLGPPGHCSADTFAQILKYGCIDAAICLPTTLEEIATRPDILTDCSGLKHIAYTTGPLSKAAGDIISRHALLYDLYGTAETGCLIQYTTDPEDWQYICLDPVHNGAEFRQTSATSSLYELVLVKDAVQEPFQGIFKVFSRLEEYPGGDVFSKHPTKPHHWKHEGRKEDMIVFRHGLTFNPTIHEHIISSHPAIQHCLLVGTGKDRPAAIIDLRHDAGLDPATVAGRAQALNSIWPTVERANRDADSEVRLQRDLIVFAKREKPFLIAGKGNVRRNATANLYEEEVATAYAQATNPE